VADIQIFAWVVFISFLIVAMIRAYRFPNLKSRRYDPMRWMLWATLFSALMLIWRAAFRCAESATGQSPPTTYRVEDILTRQATLTVQPRTNRCLRVSSTCPSFSLLDFGRSFPQVDLSRTSFRARKRGLEGMNLK
jgi:hypothetical protein